MSGAMPQHYHIPDSRRGVGWDESNVLLQGSRLLQPLSDQFGIELDQINFLFCEILGIVAGTAIRLWLPAYKAFPSVRTYRLLACGLLGAFMAFFCFGIRSLYLLAVTTICYYITRLANPRYAQLIVFVVAVGYLSYLHIYRMMKDYGGYNLDITMPMMVIVQKITAYAFAVHDGGKDPARLKLPDQPRHAIRTPPNYWEFLSYVFSFQSLLCGPFCFYDEYMDFIEGNSIEPSSYKKTEDAVKKAPTLSEGGKAGQSTEQVTEAEMLPPPQYHPSPLWPVTKKVLAAVFLCYLHIMLVPGVPLDLLTEESSLSKLSVIQLMFYLLIGTTFVRFKYYVAWLLSDAVANASGLGFNGYDELGKPKFDLVSNVDIIEFEFSQNMRSALIAWNSCTARWLRYVAYDRARFLPMMATYTLSAFWHGFYPGYYVTFISGALFTEAARWARRVFRPHFQKWKISRVVYDFMTFLTTRLCLAYVTFPFVLLEFRYAWIIYKALYFHFHVLALLAVFVLPFFLKSERKPVKDLGSQKKSDGDAPKSPSSDRLKPEQGDEGVRHRNLSPAGTVTGPGLEAAPSTHKDVQFANKPATG
ncbi:lysophospholipid acyltransferase 6-like isoform X2 [Paramacrobiotus metropolitanus]|uniref:lysophospholipid acyltransferase 6-like isoform X2 n=1 Tax=Paramacrobiotus metropolitanus TaxID=2943436 RepID=UPI0024464CB5|nr:lysophospholipid acyltransferase 6-like isoform X2 [Paramacrobiotus metropolitanus]